MAMFSFATSLGYLPIEPGIDQPCNKMIIIILLLIIIIICVTSSPTDEKSESAWRFTGTLGTQTVTGRCTQTDTHSHRHTD